MPAHVDAAAIAEGLALRTDGVVHLHGLLAAGLTRWNVARLVRDRHMHRVVRGIYVVGLPRLTQRQLWLCGELVAGFEGGLTHRSTFELHGAVSVRKGVATITTRRRSVPRRIRTLVPMETGGLGLIKVIHVRVAPPLEVVDGLRSVGVPRALVDFAASSGRKALRWLWRSAEFKGLLDLAAIERELDWGRRRGGAKIRKQVESRRILTGTGTRLKSKGELDILHLIAEAGLEMPEENVPVRACGHDYVLDFLWPHLGWGLELDSPDHLTAEAVARDQERDRHLLLAGIQMSHYLEALAQDDPVGFVDWLRRALDERHRLLAA